MSLIIKADCINCGVCEPECPNDAIFPEKIFMQLIKTFVLSVLGTLMSPSVL